MPNEWKLANDLIAIGKRDADAYPLIDAFEVLRAIDEGEKAGVEDRSGMTHRVFENDNILRVHALSADIREYIRGLLASSTEAFWNAVETALIFERSIVDSVAVLAAPTFAHLL